MSQRIVINVCHGGFGLSDKAYEKLVELGIPLRKYIEGTRDPKTKQYRESPKNEGRVIFDRELEEPSHRKEGDIRLMGRYWDTWIENERTCHLLIDVVEELGEEASGKYAKLRIVDVPDGVDWIIDEYDGAEKIAEVHREWY